MHHKPLLQTLLTADTFDKETSAGVSPQLCLLKRVNASFIFFKQAPSHCVLDMLQLASTVKHDMARFVHQAGHWGHQAGQAVV